MPKIGKNVGYDAAYNVLDATTTAQMAQSELVRIAVEQLDDTLPEPESDGWPQARKRLLQHSEIMLRTICKSRAYQSSIVTNKWNADDDINFSHAIARRLPAEVLYDTIQRTTGSVSRLPGVPAGYRAAQLPDVGLTLPSGFFEVFGRPARESSCECERSSGMPAAKDR